MNFLHVLYVIEEGLFVHLLCTYTEAQKDIIIIVIFLLRTHTQLTRRCLPSLNTILIGILLSQPCTIIFRMCSGLSYGFTMCFKCFSVLFFFVISYIVQHVHLTYLLNYLLTYLLTYSSFNNTHCTIAIAVRCFSAATVAYSILTTARPAYTATAWAICNTERSGIVISHRNEMAPYSDCRQPVQVCCRPGEIPTVRHPERRPSRLQL